MESEGICDTSAAPILSQRDVPSPLPDAAPSPQPRTVPPRPDATPPLPVRLRTPPRPAPPAAPRGQRETSEASGSHTRMVEGPRSAQR